MQYRRMVFTVSPLQGVAFFMILRVVMAAMLLFASSVPPGWAGSLSPCLNQGSKWRVAYYEGGRWTDYADTTLAMVGALMEMGWIKPSPLPRLEAPSRTDQVWDWLCTEVESDYLQFSREAYYTSDWEDGPRRENRARMIEALTQGRYDLVWALGTWAGLDLVNNDHHVPTMVMSTSDPVTAGIITDPEDSGFDHVHVRTDPGRVLRQIQLFHDIMDFSRLGVIYEDTDYGRAYAYLSEVGAAAEQAGFKLVTCQAPNAEGPSDFERAMAKYVACARRLAPEVDAFVYDDHSGGIPAQVGRTLPIFVQAGVPTWSTRGSVLVQRGVLMSLAKKDFAPSGRFFAEVMARILNGARPRELKQIFRSNFRLAINLKTAELIGYTPPPNLLRVTDDVFTSIEPPWEAADGL